MAKFMVLYSSTAKASELMANASQEQMQASMEEWMDWRSEAQKLAKNIEFGLPLQAVGRVTPNGSTDSDSQVSGYSVIEADSADEVLELLKNHPHLKRDGASIDVLEMLSMPGLDV